MQPSNRLPHVSRTGLRASPTLLINERVQALVAAGRAVYHLGFGESRFPVHPRIAQALRDNVHQRSYLPALGLPALREAIAGFYERRFGLSVTPAQVVIGPGSKSLLYALVVALDGDVILPTPAWVSYSDQAHLARKAVLRVAMDPEAGYALDVDRLRAAAAAAEQEGRRPGLLVVNTPHNPTGTVLAPADAQEAAEFARDHELLILSDEIYSLVTHDMQPHPAPAHYYREGTIVLGGLSKHLSLGGWRFGLAILPPGEAGESLAEAVRAIAGCVWSCVAAPVQYAALEAYGGEQDITAYVEACTQIHAIRTRYLHAALEEFGLSCPAPAGAFYLYPSFAKWREPLAARGVRTAEELAHHLLENYEIATLPGTAFGDDPQALTLRLSTSYLDVETDEQAAALVAAFGEDPDPDRFVQNHQPRLRQAVERLAGFIGELER